MTTRKPIAKVTNLNFSYDGKPETLCDINFELYAGEIIGLVGPNGAGKTTLIKSLTGQLPTQKGSIKFARLNNCEGDKIIALVEQHLSLYENISIAYNICLSTVANKNPQWIAKDKIELSASKVLSQFGINIDVTKNVADCSFSEKQLIEICKATNASPQILILDEPTSALDNESKSVLFGIIKKEAAKGTAIILVTHDPADLENLSDRVFMMDKGRLSEIEGGERRIRLNTAEPTGRNITSPDFETYINRQDSDWGMNIRGTKGGVSVYHFIDAWERGVVAEAIAGLTGSCNFMKLSGNDISNFSKERTRKGIVTLLADRKKYGIFQQLTVLNTCLLLGRIDKRLFSSRKSMIDKIESHLDEYDVQYPDLLSLCSELSGGNQQKLLWACVGLTTPRVIIAEEPLLGLDTNGQKLVKNQLATIARSGTIVILLTCYSHLYEGWDVMLASKENTNYKQGISL